MAVDVDSNGILSLEENRALIKAYLKASKEWTPKVVEETMAVGMEIGLKMACESSARAVPAVNAVFEGARAARRCASHHIRRQCV